MSPLRASHPRWNRRSGSGRIRRLTKKLPGRRLIGTLRSLVAEARANARQATLERLPEVAAVGRRLVEQWLAEPGATPQQIINATGVLIPDGLAPRLPLAAIERIRQWVSSDTALPQVQSSTAGQLEPVLHLLVERWGAESALVMNHTAGALAATFAGLAAEGKIVVARRHLGTACRRLGLGLTDVAALARVRLAPVGAVDRLVTGDYSAAMAPGAAMAFSVQGAEYEIVGGGDEPALADLATISAAAGIPLVVYLPTASWCEMSNVATSDSASRPLSELAGSVGAAFAAGADVVICDGHRACGGPECGVVLGQREILEKIGATPWAKVFAANRLTLAALEATLLLARDRACGERGIPLWQMLSAPRDALRNRAQRLAPQISECSRVARTEIAPGVAYLGASKLPRERLDDWRILIEPAGCAAAELAASLQAGTPGVWLAVEDAVDGPRLALSLRSVPASDDERLALAFTRLGTRRPAAPAGAPA